MRIDRNTPPPVKEASESREPAKREVSAAQPGVVVSQPTSVLTARLAEGRASRAERVEKLRSQIAGGKYHVDRQKLAERMADDELAERPSK